MPVRAQRQQYQPKVPAARLVALADLAVVLLALAAVLVGGNLETMPAGLDEFLAMRVTLKNLLSLGAFIAGCALLFRLAGLYDAWRVRRWRHEATRAFIAVSGAATLAAIFPMVNPAGVFGASALSYLWVVALTLFLPWRAARSFLSRGPRERRQVLIVGAGPNALRIYRQLCADLTTACHVVGFVDNAAPSSPFVARRTLGSLDRLEEILAGAHVDEVRIGLPVKSHYARIQEVISVCERLGVKATYHADIFDARIARPCFGGPAAPAAVVQMRVAPEDWRLSVKRMLDIVGAAAALVALLPIMAAAAVAIKATSRGPVIYRQERYGLNRRRFWMLKFRTMVQEADRLQAALEERNEADGPVFKIANDPRITRVGRFLRKTSIDELPQLVNVLRGEMSLVGPRPLPLRDVSKFTRTADLRRFSVRPGITGAWQISGRSQMGFDAWIQLDLDYIDRWSLLLDFAVLLRTIPAVLRGTGAA